jgi:hypothetical protein
MMMRSFKVHPFQLVMSPRGSKAALKILRRDYGGCRGITPGLNMRTCNVPGRQAAMKQLALLENVRPRGDKQVKPRGRGLKPRPLATAALSGYS